MKDIVEELNEWVATFDGASLSMDNTEILAMVSLLLKAAAEHIQDLRRQCQLMQIERLEEQ